MGERCAAVGVLVSRLIVGAAVHKFDYRSPRFPVDLPIQFTVKTLTLGARCIEISNEGMKLELQEPFPPNAQGTVSILLPEGLLQLDARVAHAGETHGGIVFLYKSDRERIAVAELIGVLSAFRNRAGPVLIG
jgi:hypothetical protein